MAKVLCVSYSPIFRDPRVLRQMDWLQKMGVSVDIVGLGPKPSLHQGTFFEVNQVNLIKRLMVYVFASNSYRYKKLILDQLPSELHEAVISCDYDVIQLNDLEFLPWMAIYKNAENTKIERTRVTLDLHEFFPGVKGGIVWRLITERFHKWLLAQLSGSNFDSYSTVSSEIAAAYRTELSLEIENIIWNAPSHNENSFEERSNGTINLVYHGNSGNGRPLRLYVRALRDLDEIFSLHFMVRASNFYKNLLILYSSLIGVRSRFHWRETVPVHEIGEAISKFDIELAWFPPVSENMHLSLGNKFFEAIQSHLALIIGASPSMVAIVENVGNGRITEGWSLSDLVSTINSLDRTEVECMRKKSYENSGFLSAETAESVFLNKVIHVSEL